MNIKEKIFDGEEFDWFAMDIDGNLAIFSTAGKGFIPKEVRKKYKDH